jgi:DNA polymerase-3 subunit alpha
MTFVHLHGHSQCSILDASAGIEGIAARAAKEGMPAVALTDHGNLYGAVEFFKACKGAGVKPLIGCELYMAPNSRLERSLDSNKKAAYHLTLLAKNAEGYHNLCKLSSKGFLEGSYYYPRADYDLLKEHTAGLICLSGDISSRIAQEIIQGKPEKVLEWIELHRQLFGEDFYLELQRHPMTEEALQADGMYRESWLVQQYRDFIEKQNKVNDTLIKLSRELSIPLVATNDFHYLDREDWRAHEILLNIQSGEPCEIWEKDSMGNLKFRIPNPKRRVYSSHEYYFKSAAQMVELFADVPEAISNTLVIADKCNVEMDFKTKHYPVYTPPDEHAVEEYLWKLCEEGIPHRYTPERLAKIQELFPDQDPMKIVRDRLEYEMNVIVPKEMCDYLLIVWDFINWAKRSGIPMGPGRGSGAGSIVLYLIGVTDIEPIRFHLFFERFINPERISYPDIDVDICMDRRGEVINYTLQKYGKDNIAQIITFGTMKAKMTIKDVGRALSIPLSKVNEIAKLVPDDLNITLEKALEKDPDLHRMYEADEDARTIIQLGLKLEGSIRSTGIHAAGIIISGKPLINLIPICVAKDSEMPVTQYSMKPVELVGMLKVDFLGLKTLTAIQTCVDSIAQNTGRVIDWINLPLDDAKTFELLNQGKTSGVFQLESVGMQELARNLHLDRFEEIIAVGALYRPGPMDMIPSFINRKHKREPIEYDHPWMENILSETYGIMVYQEQVMQIASKLARYSLGEGDVLRRAMGKKDAAQMAKEREKFRQGATENGIDEETSMRIFDKMEKFASYGFNKSHAAAYGYLSYVTAYMKANYPGEWMAALMTCDSDDITKLGKFIREAQSMGLEILSPDINEAQGNFMATSQGIRFAMNGIKGVGEGVVEAIVAERKKAGRYNSLYDFIKRVDAKKVGKKATEQLIDAGAFDFTGWSRDQLRMSVEPMYNVAMKEHQDNSRGVMTFFSMIGDDTEKKFAEPPKVVGKGTSKLEILLKEKQILGFYLTGHPLDQYRDVLQRLSCVTLGYVHTASHDSIFRAAFILETVEARFSNKSQKKFAITTISDGIDTFELPIWPEMFEQKGHILRENQLVYAVLQVDTSQDDPRLSCKWIDDLTQADEQMIRDCDEAFDKAKAQAARFAAMKERGAKTGEKKAEAKAAPVKEEQPKKLHLSLKADLTRHTSILKLKNLFEDHRGTSPIQIDFQTPQGTLASLQIDARWGVHDTPELLDKLKALPYVDSVKLHPKT